MQLIKGGGGEEHLHSRIQNFPMLLLYLLKKFQQWPTLLFRISCSGFALASNNVLNRDLE